MKNIIKQNQFKNTKLIHEILLKQNKKLKQNIENLQIIKNN